MVPEENPSRMRLGMWLVLAATGVLAVVMALRLPLLPEDVRHGLPGIGWLLQLAHILFVAGCGICWAATSVRLARFWAILAGASMALAWLLGQSFRFAGDNPEWARVIPVIIGLRWFALGFYGWFVLTWDDRGMEFGSARRGYKVPFLAIVFGVIFTAAGLMRSDPDIQGTLAVDGGFLLALIVSAIMTFVRIPAAKSTAP